MSFTLALLTLSLIPTLQAYKIDASCTGTDFDVVSSAALQAFDMASRANDALGATPRDSNVNRLIELLFCADGEDPATKDVTTLKDSFSGIGQMAVQNDNADTMDTDREVVLYCDMSRMQQIPDGAWADTTTMSVFSEPPNHSIAECIDFKDSTLAFTWTPKVTSRADNSGDTTRYIATRYPAQVTICPWFLQWAHNQRYKVCAAYVVRSSS